MSVRGCTSLIPRIGSSSIPGSRSFRAPQLRLGTNQPNPNVNLQTMRRSWSWPSPCPALHVPGSVPTQWIQTGDRHCKCWGNIFNVTVKITVYTVRTLQYARGPSGNQSNNRCRVEFSSRCWWERLCRIDSRRLANLYESFLFWLFLKVIMPYLAL